MTYGTATTVAISLCQAFAEHTSKATNERNDNGDSGDRVETKLSSKHPLKWNWPRWQLSTALLTAWGNQLMAPPIWWQVGMQLPWTFSCRACWRFPQGSGRPEYSDHPTASRWHPAGTNWHKPRQLLTSFNHFQSSGNMGAKTAGMETRTVPDLCYS